jgi:hypothetical protein
MESPKVEVEYLTRVAMWRVLTMNLFKLQGEQEIQPLWAEIEVKVEEEVFSKTMLSSKLMARLTWSALGVP